MISYGVVGLGAASKLHSLYRAGTISLDQLIEATLLATHAMLLALVLVNWLLAYLLNGDKNLGHGAWQLAMFGLCGLGSALIALIIPSMLGVAIPMSWARLVGGVAALTLFIMGAVGSVLSYFALEGETAGDIFRRLLKRDFRHPTE